MPSHGISPAEIRGSLRDFYRQTGPFMNLCVLAQIVLLTSMFAAMIFLEGALLSSVLTASFCGFVFVLTIMGADLLFGTKKRTRSAGETASGSKR